MLDERKGAWFGTLTNGGDPAGLMSAAFCGHLRVELGGASGKVRAATPVLHQGREVVVELPTDPEQVDLLVQGLTAYVEVLRGYAEGTGVTVPS